MNEWKTKKKKRKKKSCLRKLFHSKKFIYTSSQSANIRLVDSSDSSVTWFACICIASSSVFGFAGTGGSSTIAAGIFLDYLFFLLLRITGIIKKKKFKFSNNLLVVVAEMMIIMMGTWMKKIWGKSLLFTIKNWIQSKLIFIAISLYHTRKKTYWNFCNKIFELIMNQCRLPDVQLKENWNQNQNKQTEKIWSVSNQRNDFWWNDVWPNYKEIIIIVLFVRCLFFLLLLMMIFLLICKFLLMRLIENSHEKCYD